MQDRISAVQLKQKRCCFNLLKANYEISIQQMESAAKLETKAKVREVLSCPEAPSQACSAQSSQLCSLQAETAAVLTQLCM